MKVSLLVVAEIEIDTANLDDPLDPVDQMAEAMLRFDAFREAVLPTENYGVTLYMPGSKDLEVKSSY